MAPLVRRSWAPAGVTPVLYQRGVHHRKGSAIAALCVSLGREELRFYFRLHSSDIAAAQVMALLGTLDRELDAPWLLLWDRLHAHRAVRTRDFLRPWRAPNLLLSRLRSETESGRVRLELAEEQSSGQPGADRVGLAGRRRSSRRPQPAASPLVVALLHPPQPSFFCVSNRTLLIQESRKPVLKEGRLSHR
jgi:hypothetical protein